MQFFALLLLDQCKYPSRNPYFTLNQSLYTVRIQVSPITQNNNPFFVLICTLQNISNFQRKISNLQHFEIDSSYNLHVAFVKPSQPFNCLDRNLSTLPDTHVTSIYVIECNHNCQHHQYQHYHDY